MMHIKNTRFGKTMSLVLAMVMLVSMMATTAFAAETPAAGTYEIGVDLSCYLDAMGGVEFADYGLLTDSYLTVDEDGTAKLTLKFGQTSGLLIYNIACNGFISSSVAPGYYDDNGEVVYCDYTTSGPHSIEMSTGDTVEKYFVDTMTFPVELGDEFVYLWLYLDSNVMGCQMGDGSGTGASNQPGVETKHVASVTLDWGDLLTGSGDPSKEESAPNETTNQSATVRYTVEGGYEVSIPATITVGSDKTGSYTVALTKFVAPAGAYVTVTADNAGTLTCGEASLAFTNTLASGNLDAADKSLAGTITVTEDATVFGTYTGTLNFVINYYAG